MQDQKNKKQLQLHDVFIDFANEKYSTLDRFVRPSSHLNSKSGSPKWIDAVVKLQRLLISIIEDQEIKKIADMQYFIDAYKEFMEFKVIKGKLVKRMKRELFSENILTPHPMWLTFLSWSLVSFLSESNNMKKLKECQYCNKFFVASRNDERIKYCKVCSPKSRIGKEKQYEAQKKHRQKKKRQKNAENSKIRENAIQHYMKSLNISRNEAERLWEEENT